MTRTVLVLGASGNVGTALCRRLTGEVSVRAFYDPSTPQRPTFGTEVVQVHGTFDDATALAEAMDDVDAVFMLTPPSESQERWQRTIAQAARHRGVRRIVKLSAFDSAADSSLQMGRWHHAGEVAVAESGCEYVVLRPQYFLQMQVAAIKAATGSGLLSGPAAGDVRMAMVDVRDIAAVAAVALTGSDYSGEVLVPTGPWAFSFDELAAELADVLGREVRYVQQPSARIRADLAARGWPAWHIEDYLEIHDVAASPLVTDCVLRVTGNEPISVASFLRDQSLFSPSGKSQP